MSQNLEPREVKRCSDQGDLRIVRVESIPKGATEKKPVDQRLVVGHSETGHHHFVNADKFEARWFEDDRNGMVCYLKVEGDYADLEHGRTANPHAPHRLGQGCWKIIRQRELSLASEIRRVMD